MQMQHPDSRRTITVREDMAAMYQSQGWRQVESAEKPAPQARAPRTRTAKPKK